MTIHQICKEHEGDTCLRRYLRPLNEVNRQWSDLTTRIGIAAVRNKQEAAAVSVDYLMYSEYVVMSYLWAQAAVAADQHLEADKGGSTFLRAKLFTARFYMERLLPRTQSPGLPPCSRARTI